MESPLVSVIIPVYGVEKYIRDCLASVCQQTYRNTEIIVVNDGTKDDSALIARSYLAEMPGIRYKVLDKENGGLSSARNFGIRHADGEFLCFVDSDDSVSPDYVETLAKGLNRPNVDISCASFQMIKSDEYEPRVIDDCQDTFIYSREEILHNFLYRTVKLAPVCAMFRKNFLMENNLYFDETVRFSEDQVLFWNAFDCVKKVSYTNHIIYDYFVRNGSITTAPAISKILTGYKAINSCCADLQLTLECKKYMVARWAFGALHNTTKYCNFAFFKQMYRELEVYKNMNVLCDFGDTKTALSARILKKSKLLGYWLFKVK